jgi:hypothetical protein
MSEAKHTPGKLRIDDYARETILSVDDGRPVMSTCYGPSLVGRANAVRLVACWNVCEGIADPSAVPALLAALSAPLWLVWSNEHAAWWGPNGCHYFADISSAGRYTLEKAIEISGRRCGSQKTRETGNPGEMIQPAPEWIEARNAAIAKATGEPT